MHTPICDRLGIEFPIFAFTQRLGMIRPIV